MTSNKRRIMRVFLAISFKMAALLELVKLFSCKRKAEEEFLSCQYKMNEEMFSSLNSSIDIRSSRTFFISSKTVWRLTASVFVTRSH